MADLDRVLAVTMGDPAGIGLDVTLLAFGRQDTKAPLPAFVLIASADAVRARARELQIGCPIHAASDIAGALCGPAGYLLVADMGPIPTVVAGQSDKSNAPAIIRSIEWAVDAVERGLAAGVVTNPIAKATLTRAGFNHPGHTEFLAELAARRRPGQHFQPVMMLASNELRVVPLTVHIPLADVPRHLSRDLIITTVRIVAADVRRYFGIANPRVVVAGLNPHAGESGTLGQEEIKIIAPAIVSLRQAGLDVIGPLSADTMFHAAARARYDVAVAMYHDQALIPLKTLAFDSGVNVTLGLPFVRTSPDHGTAFDIAGKGTASPTSFIAALHMAGRMARSAGASAAGQPGLPYHE